LKVWRQRNELWRKHQNKDLPVKQRLSFHALRNQLPYAISLAWQWLLPLLCAPIMWLRCWWWQVPVGAGARWYGLMQVRRHPSAQIQLGARCVFRSVRSANPLLRAGPVGLYANKGSRIIIGTDCGFSGATLVAQQHIELGQRVLVGANVLICDGDHHPLAADLRASGAPGPSAPVVIGDDVWLGMNVVVIKGVRIGAGAVIAANAVVCADIPAGAIAAGVPARVVGHVGAMP
jgi:acetyltransferase-like isoleucine patch superfamily enzyme